MPKSFVIYVKVFTLVTPVAENYHSYKLYAVLSTIEIRARILAPETVATLRLHHMVSR